MQEQLNKITVWLNTNILSINKTKTKFILFRSSKKKKTNNISITINNELIKQVKNTTFLGVVIHECLTWEDHNINSTSKKILKLQVLLEKKLTKILGKILNKKFGKKF